MNRMTMQKIMKTIIFFRVKNVWICQVDLLEIEKHTINKSMISKWVKCAMFILYTAWFEVTKSDRENDTER